MNTRLRSHCAPLAVALLAGLVVAGCSSDDDNDDAHGNVTPAPGAMPVSTADLRGSWSTGCALDDPNDVADGYESETVSFDGTTFTAVAASFSDAGCTVAVADDDDIELDGTFALAGVVLTEDGLEATEIDFTAVPPSLAGAPTATDPRTLSDLVHIDGGTLYFGEGDFDDIRDADSDPRPGRLDVSEMYTRQP